MKFARLIIDYSIIYLIAITTRCITIVQVHIVEIISCIVQFFASLLTQCIQIIIGCLKFCAFLILFIRPIYTKLKLIKILPYDIITNKNFLIYGINAVCYKRGWSCLQTILHHHNHSEYT